jgi:hypothetical protein
MADVLATTIASRANLTVTEDVDERTISQLPLKHHALSRQELIHQPADLKSQDKKITAYCHLSQDDVVRDTGVISTTEIMEFVRHSFTLVVMEMRTTLNRWKSARNFAMTLLSFAIWLHWLEVVRRTQLDGILILTPKSVKSLSTLDVMATKTTLKIKDHANELVSIEEKRKLNRRDHHPRDHHHLLLE